MNRFMYRSGLWLLFAALVLAAGLGVYARGQIDSVSYREVQLSEAERTLSRLEAQIREYQAAIERLGWEPELHERRREGAQLSTQFSRDQLVLLQEMLAANYESPGIFSVRTFLIEQQQGQQRTGVDQPPDYRIDWTGEHVWIFEEPPQ
ncbi:hypothetical protein CKO15_11750 [Halorhodospira abdelmalekii]|uniref:hypothetical protein n=1 Tax=Halorhodospira abdelmalekii TaxID=421629 RepID=UPI0019089E5B|nr:hypothetical protein [Halorhodospira abdelmalekii]MBK1735939.1 hypothetical protein [Halorhodospira abdelmalekii]